MTDGVTLCSHRPGMLDSIEIVYTISQRYHKLGNFLRIHYHQLDMTLLRIVYLQTEEPSQCWCYDVPSFPRGSFIYALAGFRVSI